MKEKLVALADQYDAWTNPIFTPGPSPLDYDLGSDDEHSFLEDTFFCPHY
jgi:hypothetical protein